MFLRGDGENSDTDPPWRIGLSSKGTDDAQLKIILALRRVCRSVLLFHRLALRRLGAQMFFSAFKFAWREKFSPQFAGSARIVDALIATPGRRLCSFQWASRRRVLLTSDYDRLLSD